MEMLRILREARTVDNEDRFEDELQKSAVSWKSSLFPYFRRRYNGFSAVLHPQAQTA
jgi:hypothetical protein